MSENTKVDVDREQLRSAIRDEYALVAADPGHGFHFHTGRPLATMLGYRADWLATIPEEALASFAGTGNPFLAGDLAPGQQVVDVGCGAGLDTLLAARMVAPGGRVVGVDMTPPMLDRARAAVAAAGADNVDLRLGYAEELPVPDGWADVVVSNGVLNLAPDKEAAFAELGRVLRPGGRLQIGDLLVDKPVPRSAKAKIDLWTGWIAGALPEAELAAVLTAAGFTDFEIVSRLDVYAGAPQHSSAAKFGTLGITFHARKLLAGESVSTLQCALPANRSTDGGGSR